MQLDLRTLLTAFRRRTALFFAVLAGTLGVALIATLLREPLYQAQAEVVLGGEPDGAAVASIQSGAMAAKVANALHLEADPEFAGVHGVTRRLQTLFGHTGSGGAKPVAITSVVDRLARNLSVARPDNTLALTISYTATSARTAARIANAYAFAYTGISPAATSGVGDEPSDPRIIASAAVPLHPISPRPVVSMIIGIVIGSIFGLGAAVITEMRFGGLTSGADVRDRLWLPHLGNVPALSSVLPNAGSATDAVVDFPMSAFTEAFRSLWVAIQGNGGNKSGRVIAIASTLPGEGKTTVAVCLARTLALRGEPVVLIDCDAGRGVSMAFGSPIGASGLVDVLSGTVLLADALIRDDRSGGFLLPSSGSSETLIDLLAGPAIGLLIDDLRGRFRHVLIATAPLSISAEARDVAMAADALVVVIRWRATTDRAVVAALKQFRGQRVQITGAVLNQVDMRKQVKYSADEANIYQQQFSKYYS